MFLWRGCMDRREREIDCDSESDVGERIEADDADWTCCAHGAVGSSAAHWDWRTMSRAGRDEWEGGSEGRA